MTFDGFMEKMLAAFPKAEVEEGEGGELVVRTRLKLVAGDEVVEMTDEDVASAPVGVEPEGEDYE